MKISKNAKNWGIFGSVLMAGGALVAWIVHQHTKPELDHPPEQVAAWMYQCTDAITWCGVTSGDHPIAVEYLRWAAGQWNEHGYHVEVVVQAECPVKKRWVTWTVDPSLDTEAGIGWNDIDGPLSFSDTENGPESWGVTVFPGIDIDNAIIRDARDRVVLDESHDPNVRTHPNASRFTYLHEGGHTLGWADWDFLPQSGHAMSYGNGAHAGGDMRSVDCTP